MNSRLCGLWSAADLCLAGMPRKRSANAGASIPEKSVAKVKLSGTWVLECVSGGGVIRVNVWFRVERGVVLVVGDGWV